MPTPKKPGPPKKDDLLKEAKRLGLMGAESWDYQTLRETVTGYLMVEQFQKGTKP